MTVLWKKLTYSPHATEHVTGGDDVIANVIPAGNAGLMTGTDKTKLDGIAAGVNVVADANIVDHTVVRGDDGTKGIQDTGITIDDNDIMTLPVSSGIICPEKIVIPLDEPTVLANGCIWIV